MKGMMMGLTLMVSISVWAEVPAPIMMKCSSNDLISGNRLEEFIVFEYAAGQKALTLKNAKGVIVQLADDNEMRPGLYDVTLYLKNSIVTAKGVAQSSNQVNGIHTIQSSGKKDYSIYCGI